MILMNDFKTEPLELQKSVSDAVSRVLHSGWYILGKEVEHFEIEWARVCKTEYAIGVANGLDAIEIALRVLNIGKGSEVITTPMTAFATVLAIIRAGATPVLADIDPDSGLLSIESAQRCISKKTKAILLVHLYGQVKNMDLWTAFCLENKIELIEDCAQAHLASSDGTVAGSFGRIGAFSFYPTKNLGAAGDGGALITNDVNLKEKASVLRNYGQRTRYYHPVLGLNSRLDEIQAAILSERLKWLTKFNMRRQKIASAYFHGIRNPLVHMLARPENESAHVHHLFVVNCDHRDKLQKHLFDKQIQSLIHYPVPIHFQEPCTEIKRDPEGLKNSEIHASTCLSLPINPQISDVEAGIVIDAINLFKI
jgi:dTDP-4-amino-4,6-dideoxygalactose transaminase